MVHLCLDFVNDGIVQYRFYPENQVVGPLYGGTVTLR